MQQILQKLKLYWRFIKYKYRTDRSFVFWSSFIGTILVLAILYFTALNSIPSNSSGNSITNEKQVLKNFIRNFKKKLPKNLKHIDKRIAQDSKNKIDTVIENKIDTLFAPVYDNIPKFTDYHYSVTGEYKELAEAINGSIEKFVNDQIFGIDFDTKLQNTIDSINNEANYIIKEALQDIQSDISKELDIDTEDTSALLSKFANISVGNLQSRLSNQIIDGLRVGGTVTGALVAKTVAKKASSKLAVKVGSKGLFKFIGGGGGAAAGAAAGSVLGPVGTAIGAIGGGALAWFTTDKIVSEIDKAVNSEEFEHDLKIQIDTTKENMKYDLKQLYFNKLNALSKETQEKFKTINIPIED